MLKILHVTGTLDIGGAESRMLDMTRRLDKDRFRFSYLVVDPTKGVLADEMESLGASVLRVDFSPNPFIMLRRLKRVFQTEKPDIVHTHAYFFDGLILKAAARAGVPSRMVHVRTSGDGRRTTLKRRFYRFLMRRWIHKYATRIVAVSNGAMESMCGTDWKNDPRTEVLYNGIQLDKFDISVDRGEVRREWNIPPEATLVIHVGRFRPVKNHALMIEAVEAIRQTCGVDVQWLFVGEGPLRHEMQKRVRDKGLDDVAHFTGLRRDVPRLLKSADVSVLPSAWEGLPGAVLEALASGLPVIASDLPGVREIKSMCGGIDILPEISANALADRISEFATGHWQKPLDRPAFEKMFNFERFFDHQMELYAGESPR